MAFKAVQFVAVEIYQQICSKCARTFALFAKRQTSHAGLQPRKIQNFLLTIILAGSSIFAGQLPSLGFLKCSSFS
jgi:hypothetical protein